MDFADHLFCGITRQVLRPLIEYENIPLHVGGYDPIHRAGNQILEKLIGLPKFIPDPFLFCNVADIRICPTGAIGRSRQGNADFRIPDLAGSGAELNLRAGFIAVLIGLRKYVFQEGPALAAEEIGYGHLQYPGVLIAGDLRDRAVRIFDAEMPIEDQYPIVR
ncbi:MAG: hypothetical protein AABZ85_10320 [Thermodesulfobacteriota bacterium]